MRRLRGVYGDGQLFLLPSICHVTPSPPRPVLHNDDRIVKRQERDAGERSGSEEFVQQNRIDNVYNEVVIAITL